MNYQVRVTEVMNFKPQITEPRYGPEPTLEEVLYHYYRSFGMEPKDAKESKDRYVAAVFERFKS